MEMTDDSIDSRLKGIADEIKTDDMSIVKKPMISLEDDSNDYSRKIGTPFKQQKLSAWQPILTANTVIPWLLAIGIFFLPIGTLLLTTSNGIQEEVKEYTDCKDIRNESRTCAELIEQDTRAECKCSIDFTLATLYDRNVFFYYGLTNFYQNHRRYVRSRNDWQLLGYTDIEPSSCAPFDRAYDAKTGLQMKVAPCGAIANSLFNDTFELYYKTPRQQNAQKVPMLENEISWPTDRAYKFRNPSNLSVLADRFTHPVNWQMYLQDYTSDSRTAFENEHLIVWMRSAALPKFRKLYARVDHTSDLFKQGLPKGDYKVIIHYNFPVKQFSGEKWFYISNTSWLGGKNPFLGIAYLVAGTLCILISGGLFFIYKNFGYRTRDMIQIERNTPFIYSNLDQSN